MNDRIVTGKVVLIPEGVAALNEEDSHVGSHTSPSRQSFLASVSPSKRHRGEDPPAITPIVIASEAEREPPSCHLRTSRTTLALIAAHPAQAQTQRTLHIALTQEPGTLNPIIGSLAVESDLDQFLFSGLTRYDEHGNQIPDLAERVPTHANGDISADARTITYHLVHNARWHDGVPVTSADVAFTFDALRSPKNNVVVTEPYAEIARVETPDAYTVRIIMTRTWAPAIDGFSDRSGGAIVPAHLLKSLSDVNHADFNAAPVGSGPYKFVAWHRGSTIELEADPNYFRGAPKIARIDITFLTTTTP